MRGGGRGETGEGRGGRGERGEGRGERGGGGVQCNMRGFTHSVGG